VKGQYTALSTAGTPVTEYSYSAPQFYVPALTELPAVVRGVGPRTTDTDATGRPRSPRCWCSSAISAAEQWTLNGSAALDKDSRCPAIALDPDGYAVTKVHHDPSLLLPPNVVGPTQAAVVDEGPPPRPPRRSRRGPQTTGLYTAQPRWPRGRRAGPAIRVAARGGRASAVRVADRRRRGPGALRDVPEHDHRAPQPRAGSPIPVPAAFTPLLAAPTEVGRPRGERRTGPTSSRRSTRPPPQTTPRSTRSSPPPAGGGPSYGHTGLAPGVRGTGGGFRLG
jgi:hypothetical protein